MAVSPLRFSTPVTTPSLVSDPVVQTLTEEELYAQQHAGDSQLLRGFQTGSAGVSSSLSNAQALANEVMGNQEAFQANRDEALRAQRFAPTDAPRVQSFTEINGLRDAADWAAGALGQAVPTMVPAIAAGMVTGGMGASPFVGALAASAPQEIGAIAEEQYNDPTLSKMSVEDRALAAGAGGVAAGALESIVPGQLAKTAFRAPVKAFLPTVARTAGEEAVTEGSQDAVEQAANMALDPTRAYDVNRTIDAAAAGAVGGAGIQAGHHAVGQVTGQIPGLVGQGLDAATAYNEQRKARSAEGGEPVPLGGVPLDPGPTPLAGGGLDYEAVGRSARSSVQDFVERGQEALKNGVTAIDDYHKTMFPTQHEGLDDALMGMTPASRALAGMDPATPEAHALIAQHEEQSAARTKEFINKLDAHTGVTPDVKARFANADVADPAVQLDVAKTLKTADEKQQAGLLARDFASGYSAFTDGAKDLIKGFVKGPELPAEEQAKEGVTKKQNLMRTSQEEQTVLNKAVLSNLSPAAAQNEDVRKHLPLIANKLAAYMLRTDDLQNEDVDHIAQIKDTLESLFHDPKQVVADVHKALQSLTTRKIGGFDEGSMHNPDPDQFLRTVYKFSGAEEDAVTRDKQGNKVVNPNSFLLASMSPTAREKVQTSPEQVQQLANFVDQYTATQNKPAEHAKVLQAMTPYFGTAQNAALVLDYYNKQHGQSTHVDNENTDLTPASEDSNVSHLYKTPTKEPFFKEKGPQREALSTIREHRGAGLIGAASIKAVNYDTHVGEAQSGAHGLRLLQKAHDRVTNLQKTPGTTPEELAQATQRRDAMTTAYQDALGKLAGENMSEDAKRKAAGRAVSKMHEVVQLANKQDGTAASDDDLVNYSMLKNKSTSINTAKQIRAMNISFQRKYKDANGKTKFKPMALNAESMWKHAAKKANDAGEPSNASNFALKVNQYFADAMASVLARPDIELTNREQLDGLQLDRTGIKYREGTVAQGDGRQNKPLTAKQQARRAEVAEAKAQLLAKTAGINPTEALDRTIEGYAKMEKSFENATGPQRARLSVHMQAYQEYIQARIEQLTPMPDHDIEQSRDTGEIDAFSRANEFAIQDHMEELDVLRTRYELLGKDGPKFLKAMYSKQAVTHIAAIEKILDDEAASTPREALGNAVADQSKNSTPEQRAEYEASKKSMQSPSSMAPDAMGAHMTEDEKDTIRATIAKQLGPKIKVLFASYAELGASGDMTYNNKTGEAIIRVATDSLHPEGVAFHESLHGLFALMDNDPATRALKKDLLDYTHSPELMKRLRELLEDHPEALDQIAESPEERLAYMFQFYMSGDLFKRDGKAKNMFDKLLAFLHSVLGTISADDKMKGFMDAFAGGELSDTSLVHQVIQDKGLHTIDDKLNKFMPAVGKVADRLIDGATDSLRNTQVPALGEIADKFLPARGTERSHKGWAFLDRRSMEAGRFKNRFASVLEGTTGVERTQALRNLQSMKPPSTKLEKEIASILKDVRDYMVAAGVKRFDNKTGKWKTFGHVSNYFPRVWDQGAIARNSDAFADAMKEHGGLSDKAISKMLENIMSGDGMVDLKETEGDLGFTPYAKSVQQRALDFIKPENAADFMPFQSTDLTQIMTTYIDQAAHRAEYSRSFNSPKGTPGGWITQKLIEAKRQGATDQELRAAQVDIQALEGTLGRHIDPQLNNIMGAIITMENLIILPLTMFSQFQDIFSIALRSNNFAEAGKAFMEGMNGFARAIKRLPPTEHERMASLLGIIDEEMMLDAMGQVYGSAHMKDSLRKINKKFFKWNGMESWNRSMRIAGMKASGRFILDNADNKRYMGELGLQQGDVLERPNGELAITRDDILDALRESNTTLKDIGNTPGSTAPTQGKTYAPSMSEEELQAKADDIASRVHLAVWRFTDSAVLRPNAAHRPAWGSDPHWQLLFHLKQFTFSFQNVILKHVKNEQMHNNNLPMQILMASVPFAMFTGSLKRTLMGAPPPKDLMDAMSRAVAASGIMGTSSFGADMVGDVVKGNVPGSSLMGPAFDHLNAVAQGVVGNKSLHDVVMRTIPGGGALKNLL